MAGRNRDDLEERTKQHAHLNGARSHHREAASILCIADLFRKLIATAADIPLHRDPDSIVDGWFSARAIFNIQLENKYMSPLEYSGHKVSALHLVYALLTYGLDPNELGLDLLKRFVAHRRLRELLRKFWKTMGKPNEEHDLMLMLKPEFTWNDVVEAFFAEEICKKELKGWARKYFEGLLIPVVAAKGTPSSNGTGSDQRVQAALRELCLKRDGHMTVVGRIWNRFWRRNIVPPPRNALNDYGRLKACHIIPLSFIDSPNFRSLLLTFSGDYLVGDMINHTSNAFMLTADFISSFRRFEWSIDVEPDQLGNPGTCVFRKFHPLLPRYLDQHSDYEQVSFGLYNERIPCPNAQMLHLYTALAKVANASGTVDVIDEILRDEDDMKEKRMTGRDWGKVGQNYLVRQLQRLSVSEHDLQSGSHNHTS